MTNQVTLRGKIGKLQEALDRYKEENECFIMVHGALSVFRALRCFLIPPDFSNARVYDVIVPRVVRQTSLNVKQEEVRRLKADMGMLSPEEKAEMQREAEIDAAFMKNPLFYADIIDLLVDINFKHYLKTEFNVVFSEPDLIVERFIELDDKIEEIFIASIKSEEDKAKARKAIEKIMHDKKYANVFYTTYKNILDISSMSLQLKNFAETEEFFEGLDSAIKDKCKVSPLRTKGESSNDNSLRAPDTSRREMVFGKSLNKKPIRKVNPKDISNTTKMPSILPILPQRYIIDKKNFKVPSLRHVTFAATSSCSMTNTNTRCWSESRGAQKTSRKNSKCRRPCNASSSKSISCQPLQGHLLLNYPSASCACRSLLKAWDIRRALLCRSCTRACSRPKQGT
eukprot:TRINITY_DN4300_c0_g1_i4.p1 TRINITY_DN4300_c0_g1~~TRINITY_DN4300_c0_g1_i4.p1  ORF type:complete len:398 (-),score=81.72 TRINITY_DN4300_c0_g1_i4:951-2144(-)